MEAFSHVPPGFRFHPTDEELVDYYLRKKMASKRIDLDVIKDVDLYKIEPWDLQELCKLGSDDQNEWYFFSHKDKKYPTGTRTNRATKAGFWKATGRDKAIYARSALVGMRKTLVFYKGRAPNGQKSDWIMHEYRLQTLENGPSQEEGWAVCRVFKKRMASTERRMGECWYDHDQVSSSFMPQHSPNPNYPSYPHNHYTCKQELELMQYNINNIAGHHAFLQLPQLESPKLPPPHSTSILPYAAATTYDNNNNNGSDQLLLQCQQQGLQLLYGSNDTHQASAEQVTDWRVLDKFVASQLTHDDQEASKENGRYDSSNINVAQQIAMLANGSEKNMNEIGQDQYASTSTTSSDLWK